MEAAQRKVSRAQRRLTHLQAARKPGLNARMGHAVEARTKMPALPDSQRVTVYVSGWKRG